MDRFDKGKSIQLKGVAILFMFWLHLYGHDDLIQNGNYYTEFWGGNRVTSQIISYLCSDFFVYSRIWCRDKTYIYKDINNKNRNDL